MCIVYITWSAYIEISEKIIMVHHCLNTYRIKPFSVIVVCMYGSVMVVE